jgi:hypothetical protein
LGIGRQCVGDPLDQSERRHRHALDLQLAGLDFREIQDVVDDLEQ